MDPRCYMHKKMRHTFHSHTTPSETAKKLGGGIENTEMKGFEATAACGSTDGMNCPPFTAEKHRVAYKNGY